MKTHIKVLMEFAKRLTQLIYPRLEKKVKTCKLWGLSTPPTNYRPMFVVMMMLAIKSAANNDYLAKKVGNDNNASRQTFIRFLFLKIIEHSENKVSLISKTRLGLECSSSAFNRHASSKNAKQLRQNQNTITISALCLCLLAERLFVECWIGALQFQPRV